MWGKLIIERLIILIEIDLFEISRINSIRIIHLFSCLTGAFFLLILWNDGRKKVESAGNDLGAVFVAFALLLWSAMDLYRLMGLMVPGEVSVVLKTFSAYNNAFFIASFPYFRYVYNNQKRKHLLFANGKNWALIVFLINIFIVMFYTISWGENDRYANLVKNFDVVYSVTTFTGLGYAIFQTFRRQKNQRKAMSIMAIIITLLLILPQIFFASFFKIKHFDVLSLTLLCSQYALICLLIVVAIDWINELNEEHHILTTKDLENEITAKNHQIRFLEENIATTLANYEHLKLETEANVVKITQQEQKVKLAELSDRELMVLRKINKSYTEIANELFIAKETVISHKKNIETKLQISGKENLTEFAKAYGILDDTGQG